MLVVKGYEKIRELVFGSVIFARKNAETLTQIVIHYRKLCVHNTTANALKHSGKTAE